MSYLVFARKWRPQSFDEVLAQDHVTITLKNAIDNDRIGHAYLMTGPRGVGKTTTARIFAKALNCEEGPSSHPCQKCDACRSITSGNHMDVREIDGASNRGIDQIRDLREKARYATASARYKIYIIDEVHMLTKEAFNALLKILEEPPEAVIFIFATTEPRKLPDTILSRCQRFDFRRIPVNRMSQYLEKEASREGISIDRSALGLVCRASGGSMRDALSLMDQLVSYSGNEIHGEDVAGLLGMVETDLLASITAGILAGNTSKAIDDVSRALADGYSVDELLDALIGFLRNLLLVVSSAKESLAELPESELKLLSGLSRDVPDVAVLNVLRIMTGASVEVRRSNLPRITLETAVMTASKLSVAFDLKDLPSVVARVSETSPVFERAEDIEFEQAEDIESEQAEDIESEQDEEVLSEPAEDSGSGEAEGAEKKTSEDDKADTEEENEEEQMEKERKVSQDVLGLFDAI